MCTLACIAVFTYRHKNIASLYGYFWDENCFYLIQEYGCHGDILKFIKDEEGFSEKKAAWYIRRIAEGIKYMHDNNVIHRDIKAENIVIGEGVRLQCLV